MRVALTVAGGLAATVNAVRPPAALDTTTLPPALDAELVALVRAAAERPVAAGASGRPWPDEQHYQVTVEDGRETQVIAATDSSMSPQFADLLGWIEQHA
ncbi:protealysin inhibitor emfourin [Actinomycetospora sp.]|jgi:hypothetical protein|uniref:protealysin inhibitor emfourin n=1 Tax=Actinomycetospora sp. TaxID=1872135 RepID=UPI002F3E9C13